LRYKNALNNNNKKKKKKKNMPKVTMRFLDDNDPEICNIITTL